MKERHQGRARARLSVLLAVALAALAAAAFAATGAVAAGGAAKDTIVALEESIAPALDYDGPSAADPQSQEIMDNLMDPLISYPTTLKDGVLIPNYRTPKFESRLAESYTKRGTTFTFKLRKNVKSCAGNTLTADDVIYTFQRAKSVSGASPTAWFLGNVGGVLPLDPLVSKDPKAKELKGEVVKVDDYTVRFK